ncbi:MAG: Fe-S cluster assembly sulfur transfer protein SufU [Gammaproteobacteria bacterium]
MSLEDLYQDLILDHGTKPRNFVDLPVYTHHAEGFNPLCGDKVELKLVVNTQDQTIEAACFQGSGCAIAVASGSLMTEYLKGKSLKEAQIFFESFQAWLLGQADQKEADKFGKLEALAGVKQFPARVKCATLAWHAFLQAIK